MLCHVILLYVEVLDTLVNVLCNKYSLIEQSLGMLVTALENTTDCEI